MLYQLSMTYWELNTLTSKRSKSRGQYIIYLANALEKQWMDKHVKFRLEFDYVISHNTNKL